MRAVAVQTGALPPGHTVGGFAIIRRLAVGGMAEVYLARHRTDGPSPGRAGLVALKRMLPHLVADDEFVRMFRRETSIAATLDHPNIVRVFDAGEDDGIHYLAMEYLRGLDLHRVLEEAAHRGGLPLECGLAIVSAAAQGLHYAHERSEADGSPMRIVHRDVSPSNIFVGLGGEVKVLDFGVASAASRSHRTTHGVLKGKVGYMSPEQCRGQALDRRSDVFALGVVLYEATTGRRLFRGDDPFVVMNRIVTADVPAPSTLFPDYPAELEAIVVKALALRADDRFASAGELGEALARFAARAAVPASAARVAAYMAEVFGPPPELGDGDATVPSVGAPPASQTVMRTHRSRRSTRSLASVAGLGVLVVLAGLGVLQLSELAAGDASPRESPPRPSEAAIAEVPDRPSAPPVPAVDRAAAGSPSPSLAATAPAADAAAPTPTRREPTRKKSRARSRPAPDAATEPTSKKPRCDPDDPATKLFPRSYCER